MTVIKILALLAIGLVVAWLIFGLTGAIVSLGVALATIAIVSLFRKGGRDEVD